MINSYSKNINSYFDYMYFRLLHTNFDLINIYIPA